MKPSKSVRAYLSAIGRKGGKKGGKTRRAGMTPEEHSKAAEARWAKHRKRGAAR